MVSIKILYSEYLVVFKQRFGVLFFIKFTIKFLVSKWSGSNTRFEFIQVCCSITKHYFVDRVSEMIADHKKEAKSQVKNHIRTRFRFDLLRSTLIALRGIRGRSTAQHLELQDISFNLIPQKTSFEVS